jgi:hypothetical protein
MTIAMLLKNTLLAREMKMLKLESKQTQSLFI